MYHAYLCTYNHICCLHLYVLLYLYFYQITPQIIPIRRGNAGLNPHPLQPNLTCVKEARQSTRLPPHILTGWPVFYAKYFHNHCHDPLSQTPTPPSTTIFPE